MPTISIALATYNGGRFIQEQLDSFAAQTRLPDELVVGDDGSTDETLAILEKFARTAPFPVRIQRNPGNYGYSRNFCETVERCSGDIIFLSDQDDYWIPQKIEQCVELFQASPGAALVSHDATLADADLRPSGITLGQQIAASGQQYPGNLMHGCCLAFDAILKPFLQPAPDRWHDVCLVRSASIFGARRHVDQPLILYRRHGNNESSSHLTQLRKTGRMQALRNRWREIRAGGEDMLSWSIDEQERVLAAIDRAQSELVARFGPDTVRQARDDLAAKRKTMIARRTRLARGFPLRQLTVATAYLKGGYAGIGGVKSAAKDFVLG